VIVIIVADNLGQRVMIAVPVALNLVSVADNLSLSVIIVANNVSRKWRMIASPTVYNCKPLQIPKMALPRNLNSLK